VGQQGAAGQPAVMTHVCVAAPGDGFRGLDDARQLSQPVFISRVFAAPPRTRRLANGRRAPSYRAVWAQSSIGCRRET